MNTTSKPVIAVIIPYFQRERGILEACIASILQQDGPFDLRVVITDDESPVPASDELVGLAIDPETVLVIRQKNAGPGAARNCSLDHLPANTDYVALMDSDDAWEPGFLAHAASALNRGYDLFFSDSRRFGQEASRFNWNKNPDLNLNPANHLLIDPEWSLYEYQQDFFDYMIRRSNILSSSAMVYRLGAAPHLRFDTTLYNGQDRLFKLALCKAVQRVAFTPRALCIEGEGINIFDSAGWGSGKSLAFAASYIDLSKRILKQLPLSDEQRSFVRGHLGASRHAFTASLLHLLLRGQAVDRTLLARTLRNDPATFCLFIPNAVKAGVRKLRARRT